MTDATPPEDKRRIAALRNQATLAQAREAGLLARGKNARIAGRVPKQLVAAAKKQSGLSSDTEVLEIALARLALEDNFGARLVRRKGSVPKAVKLGI